MSGEDIMQTETSSSAEQEAVVTRFAHLIGTVPPVGFGQDSSSTMSGRAREAELLRCISDSVNNDAVVCTLPSLSLKVTEECDNPLPAVGQHMIKSQSKEGLKPVMEASILSADEHDNQKEFNVAQQLAEATSWTKSSIVYASDALNKNLAESFSKLVDSRVKSWTLLMFKKSLASGDNGGRANLLKMLASSIAISAVKSSFRTVPLPESAKNEVKEADVILPLLFECVLKASVEGRSELVTVRAPGTITGNFAEDNLTALSSAVIQLDTGALLNSMVDQARMAVFKTVANVTTGISNTAAPKPAAAKAATGMSQLPGGFNSSLRLSKDAATQSPALAKARSSALRLNTVLQTGGKTEHPTGVRKNRSVQFDIAMPLASKGMEPSLSKKPRVGADEGAATANRLKSFKSFGRPHAEDSSGGPRNATFANYGRQQIWGRDGKLANHPMPVNSLEKQRLEQMGEKVTGSVNATFGAPSVSASARLHSASGLGLSRDVNNSNNSGAGVTRLPSNLPRTATALESWLMNATGN